MKVEPVYIKFQKVLHIGVIKPNRLHFTDTHGLIAYIYPNKPIKKQNLSFIFEKSKELLNPDLISQMALPFLREIVKDVEILNKRYDSKMKSILWRIKKIIYTFFKELSLIKHNPYVDHEIETRKALKDFTTHINNIILGYEKE